MAALVRQKTALAADACHHAKDDPAANPAPCGAAEAVEIARLYKALDTVTEQDHPRTARLIAAGCSKMAQKLVEEAGELAIAAARHRPRAVVRESADLLYHLIVLWRACGIAPEEVWAEMRARADRLGIAEKLPKPGKPPAPASGTGG